MANQFDVERIDVEGFDESYLCTLHNPETDDSIAIEQTCHGGEKVVKDTLINMLTVVPAKAVFDLFGIDMAVFAPKKKKK